jgi:NADPH:quinone reductase-like Zn-dependent oxidoreductase
MYPLMLGHEGVGRVIKVGRRSLPSRKAIWCAALRGPLDGYACGWGSYSEYGVVCDPKWDETAYGPTPECAFGQTVLPEDCDPWTRP